jgi:BirA family biotin operon repressor/biotin-[acetyl-CoA-carboxylase] ligase
MNRINRILEILYDRGEAFSMPEELAATAGMTKGKPPLPDRQKFERAVETLRQRGHRFETSPACGLRLSRPVRLDAHLIERDLHTRRIGRSAICFDEVDSTSDVAFSCARQAGSDGLVVLAESQRRGRGRLGRRWVSPAGRSVLMSVLLIDEGDRLAEESLPIATGLAVAEGIEDAARSSGALALRLKWPNDVLLEGAKVSGILVEVRRPASAAAGKRTEKQVVLGIGINVNAAPPAEEVASAATCLADHVGHPLERIEVIRAVLRRLEERIARIARGDFEELHSSWLPRCGMLNERATIVCEGRRHTGRVLDVSPLEGLFLCEDSGARVHLPAAKSSVVV